MLRYQLIQKTESAVNNQALDPQLLNGLNKGLLLNLIRVRDYNRKGNKVLVKGNLKQKE